MCLPEYLHRALQDDFAHLGTKILKGAPSNRV
ncbi:hypothetical protein ABIB28_002718 [Sphingomonas sp. UYEF23]